MLVGYWRDKSSELDDPRLPNERKHKRFMLVCDSRLAEHFRTSWMHARSSWQTLSPQHQWFHGLVQTLLLDSSLKILKLCMWSALYISAGIVKTCVFGKFYDVCRWHNTNSLTLAQWSPNWLHVSSHGQKVAWENLSGFARCRVVQTNEFGWISAAQALSKQHIILARSDAMLGFRSSCRYLYIRECH